MVRHAEKEQNRGALGSRNLAFLRLNVDLELRLDLDLRIAEDSRFLFNSQVTDDSDTSSLPEERSLQTQLYCYHGIHPQSSCSLWE